MRVALVVAPVVRPQQDAVSSGTVRDALARNRFRVVDVSRSANLTADLAWAIDEVEAGNEVVVYVAGSTRLRDGLAELRVAGDDAWLSFSTLGDKIFAREPGAVLFFVDARHDGAADDGMLAAEHVDAVVRTLEARTRGFGVLVGARSTPPSEGAADAWPFTGFVLRALDDAEARDTGGWARVSRVFDRVRSFGDLNALVQSFTFVKGKGDFLIGAPPFAEPTPEPPANVIIAPEPSVIIAPEPASIVTPDPPASGRASHPPISAPVSSQAPTSLRHPRPHLTPLLLGADEAREREDWDEALDAFKKALMLVDAGDAPMRATIYADIGEVKRLQGKAREAELNYEKALGAVPAHKRSLAALIEMATENKEHKRVVDLRKRTLPALKNDADRASELARISGIYAADLKDPRGAIESLERATALRPGDTALLQKLRALFESLQRWPRVADVLGAIADTMEAGKARAEIRFERADVMLARLRDEARGVELLEHALEDDPTHDKALHALVAVRTARQEWQTLALFYGKFIDRLAHLGDKDRAWDACRKLAVLRRDKLRDGAGALEAFTGALECKPLDVDTRAMLAELYLAKGDEAAALGEFEMIAAHAPTRASTFARLFALHSRAGRRDRAWLAAQALVELGSTDMDHELAADQFRPDGQIRPRSKLEDTEWDTWLRAPGADDVVTGILGAIVPAAVKMRVAELRDTKKLVTLDAAKLQSPKSTASVVRSFVWASHVLGVTLPDLYVMDNIPGGVAAAQVERPSTAVGPDVLRDVTTQELAFVVGRHLAYYRPEHYALVFFPSLQELTTLFLAAVKVALPEVPVPIALGETVARMRKALIKHASLQEREWLEFAVKALEERGGRVDLGAWVKSVELSAGRAGFLLCGDLEVALKWIKRESRAIAELTSEDRRRDLLAFSASAELAALREKLAVGATSSTHPPPPPSAEPSSGSS